MVIPVGPTRTFQLLLNKNKFSTGVKTQAGHVFKVKPGSGKSRQTDTIALGCLAITAPTTGVTGGCHLPGTFLSPTAGPEPGGGSGAPGTLLTPS